MLAKLGRPLCALIIALIITNLRSFHVEPLTFELIDSWAMPLAIPLLFGGASLRELWRHRRFIGLFLLGSVGTVIGASVVQFGWPNFDLAVNGLFCATYIGGTVNLLSMANILHTDPALISPLIMADNLLMGVYFLLLFSLGGKGGSQNSQLQIESKAYGLGGVFIAFGLLIGSDWIGSVIPRVLSSFLQFVPIVFTIRYTWLIPLSFLCFSLSPTCRRLAQQSEWLAQGLITLFFASLGLRSELWSVLRQAPVFLLAATILVSVQFSWLWCVGRLFGFSKNEILLAGNANIGGPTTAAAMAQTMGWDELILPSMLAGVVGYAIGNPLAQGFLWMWGS